MVKHYYKVKYGFDATSFVTVEDGPELEKAIYAWIKQTPVAIGGRMINGKNIISIEPNYHKYTGWYDNYVPKSGEDWKQIERDCPTTLDAVFTAYTDRVRTLMASNQTNLIGTGEKLDVKALKAGG